MSLSNEELMLTLIAKQNATDVFSQVDKSARSMSSNVCSVVSSMNDSMRSFGQITDNVMQGLTGKSAMDNIFGTASKAETNKVLVRNMTETEEAFNSLYDTIDKTTDSSLTSMQELIPAMNAFKAATAASDKDIESITGDMANFGAAVLAQTGSADLAQSAMMDLSKGIKGAFASLDQYGVSEDALMRTGLWSGKEDDVKGYMAAVTKVIGSTDALMETNQGLDAQIGKAFSRAGKKIGNEILPQIKDLKKGFLDLDTELGGGLSASILMVSAGLDTANSAFWNFSTTVKGVRDLKDTVLKLNDALRGTKEAAEIASDAMDMGSNISQIGADVGGVTSSVGNVSKEVKTGKEVVELSPEIIEAASFANNGFGYNAESTIEEIEKYVGTVKTTEKDSLKLLDDAIESQKVIGGKKIDYSEIVKEVEKQDWGLSNAIKHNISNQKSKIDDAINSLKSFVNEGFGTKLQNSLKKICDVPMDIKNSFSSFGKKLESIKDDGIGGSFKKIDKSLYKFIKGSSETEELLDDAIDMGDKVTEATKNLKNTKNIAGATEEVVEGASAVGAIAPEAAAASNGVEATAAATTTLSGAFTSMIVPLLAVAAVIAIMIPIATGLILEALIFLNIIQKFFASMNFDVDLSKNIEGIKELAEGIAWIGIAMGAMTFTGIMTGLAVMTGGLLGITGPLEIAKDALVKAAEILKDFSSIGIDPSVPKNLENISNSLMSVSKAMMALTATNISTGFSNFVSWVFGFSSNTSAIEQAKDDLIKASSAINNLAGGIEPLKDEDASKIQNVCDSLASVGDAIGALRSIRDGQNWDNIFGGLMEGLFGKGLDIEQALNNVKEDIAKAASALKEWNIEEIPEGTGEKVKKVADTLKGIKEAFEVLRSLRDDGNWDGLVKGVTEFFGGETDLQESLTKIKTQLYYTATNLNGLGGMPSVQEGIGEKVKGVTNTLNTVSEAVTGLTSLPTMEDYDPSSVTNAVTNVQNAAAELGKLNETTFDGTTADSILGSIQTTLENLKNALSAASGFSESSTNIGSQIVSGVQSGLSPLTSMVQGEIISATTTAASDGLTGGVEIGTNITNGFKSALNLHSVMETEMAYVKQAVDSGISAAKAAAESGAQEIVAAFKSGVNVGSPGDIARTMKQELIYTKEFIVGAVGSLKQASYSAAKSIVDSFGNPILNIESNFNMGNIGALGTVTSRVPDKFDNRPVTIIVSEGAVQLDVRNMTAKESRQILITALESLDNITSIQTNGV